MSADGLTPVSPVSGMWEMLRDVCAGADNIATEPSLGVEVRLLPHALQAALIERAATSFGYDLVRVRHSGSAAGKLEA